MDMSKGWIIALGIGGSLLLLVVIMLFYGIGVSNKEARLRNQITAKQTDNTNEYDNMWKKIKQSAEVTDGQKEALRQIFVDHAKARSGDGGKNAVMLWIKESIPNVDTSTFNQLMNIVTGSRDRFTMRQKELLDFKREHDNMIDTFPSSMILSFLGRGKIDVVIVTSTRTKEAFRTGEDDDTSVFDKGKKPAEK
jgi:hypothetical protein